MANVINITWHPDRTEPTEESASMQVDMSDGTQILVLVFGLNFSKVY